MMREKQPKEISDNISALRQRIAELEHELQNRRLECHKQLDLAAKIHQTLLPKPTRHPLIDVDIRYLPIEQVGGDYCQVRFFNDNVCYITMCDVTGHGIGPALMATRVSSEVRHCILKGHSPREIVKSVNALIWENFKDTHSYPSFIAARLELDERRITWSGAGHPSPLILRAKTLAINEMKSQNTLFGVHEDCLSEEPEHTLQLQSGDRLFFYTDGLTETMTVSGNFPGMHGLADLAKATLNKDIFDVADVILKKTDECGSDSIPDDKTLIVAEIK